MKHFWQADFLEIDVDEYLINKGDEKEVAEKEKREAEEAARQETSIKPFGYHALRRFVTSLLDYFAF